MSGERFEDYAQKFWDSKMIKDYENRKKKRIERTSKSKSKTLLVLLLAKAQLIQSLSVRSLMACLFGGLKIPPHGLQ